MKIKIVKTNPEKTLEQAVADQAAAWSMDVDTYIAGLLSREICDLLCPVMIEGEHGLRMPTAGELAYALVAIE